MKLASFLLSFALLPIPLGAQVPAADRRNTFLPGTDTHFELRDYPTRAAWEQRKAQLRLQILSAAGLYPLPPRTPLHAQVFGRIEHKGYSIEKVLLETLPGYYVGGNLFRPAGAGKKPGVLHPHGHWPYGRLENEPLDSNPEFAMNLARQGYVVFSWDMVGYNDTLQTPHSFGSPAEQLWSFGPLGLQLWNSIRALDFLTALEDVDATRIGMAGPSGGATQTLLLAAVDDRVQFAAPVNMVSTIMQGGDTCENAPGLRVATNNVEIAGLFAPKPLLLVSATGDWTRNTPQVEFPAVRKIYELYGHAANVETLHIDAPHNFNRQNREAVYRFFGHHMLGDNDAAHFVEKNEPVEMLQNVLALAGRSLPAGAANYSQVFAGWRAMPSDMSLPQARQALQLALGVEWPAQVTAQPQGEMTLLTRGTDRVPVYWTAGHGTPAVLVDAGGAAAARNSATAARLLRAGRPLLIVEAFQTGANTAPRDRTPRHFLAFNYSDDQCRVQDILTALAFVAQRQPGRVELFGNGDAALWALFATAASPHPVTLASHMLGFKGTDEEYLARFHVPGIQRAGGLAAAQRLVAAGQ